MLGLSLYTHLIPFQLVCTVSGMGHRFALARRALSLPSSTSTPSPARLAPAVVDLAAGFESFLVTTPWATTFSRAPEVQLILASFPLIVMGFVGVAFAVLELSSGRMNRFVSNYSSYRSRLTRNHRARLDLFIALAAAFLAGLLSLLNVLRTEAIRLPLMSIPLRLGEAIALSTFVLFRTYYLFRTCFQIGRRPLLSTNKDLGRDEKSVAKLELVNEILRWKSYALLAAIFALQLVWRIGFVTRSAYPLQFPWLQFSDFVRFSLTTFRSVYTISQIVELVFLAFLVGKSIVLVRSTEIATKRALASFVHHSPPAHPDADVALQNCSNAHRYRHARLNHCVKSLRIPLPLLRNPTRPLHRPRHPLHPHPRLCHPR